MQPLQYALRDPAAKDNSITHAAAARSNLDAAITMRSAVTELQNTIELRAMTSETAAPKPDGSRRQSEKKTILKHFLKGFSKGKSLAPKWRKSAIYHHRFKKRIELRTQEQPLVAEHRGGTDWTRNDPNRTRRTHEVPFIAGWRNFTRKNTRFRAPASSPKESPCNIHAAITMRFTAWRG